MKYNRGDIYWAEVKYEDSETVENRPILIWNENEVFCISFKITSTNRGDDELECSLKDWQREGLNNPSYVRLNHLIKINKSKIINKIGEISYLDMFRIQERLSK